MDFEKENWWQEFKVPIALSLVGLVLIIGGAVSSGIGKAQSKQYPKESLVSDKTISVDVSGAVKNPSVYQFNENARIEEAISSAGGFSDDADLEYISKYINMAQKLVDGTKIYIPANGESISAAKVGQVVGTNTSAKININTATQAELESLDGIGISRASDIISGRPYQRKEELIDKKIIGKAVFEKIKDFIVVY
ncbi:helix-hairpin-helix domain-containing protein [Candidatus Daviesbacteria bacterium]|nr:helix-hairpin-helix domain-containing protein [Candidatus Daviesbacteria bacterium]